MHKLFLTILIGLTALPVFGITKNRKPRNNNKRSKTHRNLTKGAGSTASPKTPRSSKNPLKSPFGKNEHQHYAFVK